MDFVRIKKRINLLGIIAILEFTYPKKYKLPRFIIPRSFLKIIFYAFVFMHVASIAKTYIKQNDIAYSTRQIPFLNDVYSSVTHPKKYIKPVEKKTESIVFHGDRVKKRIALTFDADMTSEMVKDLKDGKVESYYDNGLIDLLNNTQTKATLFLSGMWIEEYRDVALNLSQNSLFELANHSYSHPGFDGDCYGLRPVRDEDKIPEIVKTQMLLKELTGAENKLFRFPGGCYSQPDLETTKKIGVIPIQWDVAGKDGFNEDMISIVANVVSNVKNGSIIVLHMNGYPNEPETANALPFIISTLRENGYEFVTVSELLSLNEDSPKTVKSLFSLKLE